MRSKIIDRLLRFLILAIGAGAGAGLAFLCIQVNELTGDEPVPLATLILLYGGMSALGALGGYLAAPRMLAGWRESMTGLEKRLESLSAAQLISMVVWIMAGLLVASLLTQVLRFMGEGILAMALSATCYLTLAVLGLSIGVRRADDMADLLSGRFQGARENNGTPKVLDSSALCDGRFLPLWQTGLVEGPLWTASCVQQELHRIAESGDAAKRARAQRGIDTLRALGEVLQMDQTKGFSPETDVTLMTMAREKGAILLTCDPAMLKAARLAGVQAISLNDVAQAMRTATVAGDVLHVRIMKEGREAHQGVGYLEDGAMVVVEGAAVCMGEQVEVLVNSVLQTSAGRMVFARMKEETK